MKTKEIKKLRLNKSTVSHLDNVDLEKIKGGLETLWGEATCTSCNPGYTCNSRCTTNG